MALVKTVEMRILADAGDAQARLDELTAKADKLDGDAIRMKFRLDDTDGKAQLDAIRAKADELGFKDVSIKVRVDGAGKAIADLMAVRHEADKLSGGSGPNKLQSLLGRLFGVGGSGGGGAEGGAEGGSIPLEGVSGPLLAGIAAAVPAVEALLVEVTGLVSGFAAAGAGAGAFYLLAHPAISNLTGDMTALDAANQKVGFAQNAEQINPTKANALALKNAQVQYQAIYQQMGQDAGPAAAGMIKLHDTYVKLSTAFQPDVFKVFNAGLKVANQLLPATLPFAKTFASALTGLLGELGKATQSKGFAQFLAQFHSLEGPAVTAIGQGLGKVGESLGKLLTTMNAADVSKSIGIAFNVIAGTISGLASAVHNLMTSWDGMSSAAKHTATHVVGAFKSMASGIETSWSTAIGVIQAIPGKIESVFKDAGSWLLSAGKAIMEGLLKGLESMAGAVIGEAEHIGSSILHGLGNILHFGSPSKTMITLGLQTVQGLVVGILSQVPVLGAAAAKAASAMTSAVKTEVAYAKSVAASAMSGLALTSINLSTDTVVSGMQSYLASMKSFTADIKALSAQHLNKTLMQQLIAAGPVTGDQYAQSILQGGGAGQVNALYKQIGAQAALLGAQSAMSVYGNKVTPSAGGGFSVTVNVNGGLGTGTGGLAAQGQAIALEIIKLLKEYKRHGGGKPLGLA